MTVGGGADYVALAQKVDDKIQALADAILNATPTPQDGGAAILTAANIALGVDPRWSADIASTKTKTD